MRYKFQGTFQDRLGHIVTNVEGGKATFYLAGSTTLATIYAASSGGSAIANSLVNTDANGYFEAWVDDNDYSITQLFKIVLSATGFNNKTYDDLTRIIAPVNYYALRVVEATTNTATATTKGGDWEVPYTCTITGIGAFNDTAGVTGTMTIDVNKNGTTIMNTNKITIDTAEKTSRTAAVAPVLTTTALAVGDIVTIDIDGIHTTAAKGLTVWLNIRTD